MIVWYLGISRETEVFDWEMVTSFIDLALNAIKNINNKT